MSDGTIIMSQRTTNPAGVAGANTVWYDDKGILHVTTPDGVNHISREVLTTSRTYYVATTGSDSNTGLVVGSPFLTIQKAINVAGTLDCSIYNITISVADGTYNEDITIKNILGSGTINLTGNSGTPANVTVKSICKTTPGTIAYVNGFTITGGTWCLYSTGGADLHGSNVILGIATYHLFCIGARLTIDTNYTVTGDASYHWIADGFGVIAVYSKVVTFSGTRTFSVFANALEVCFIDCRLTTYAGTFSSVVGQKYQANGLSYINSTGATLPGSIAGSTSAGGQYS